MMFLKNLSIVCLIPWAKAYYNPTSKSFKGRTDFVVTAKTKDSTLSNNKPLHYRKKNQLHLLKQQQLQPNSDTDFLILNLQNEDKTYEENNFYEQTSLKMSSDSDDGNLSSRLGSKSSALIVGVTALITTSGLAYTGLLSKDYTSVLILQDVGSTVITAILASVFVKAISFMASKGILEPRDSRKIIHTLSAPLFILFWPIFSTMEGARFFAAVVPLVQFVRLVIAGTNGKTGGKFKFLTLMNQTIIFIACKIKISKNLPPKHNFINALIAESELANSISRSGDEKEALGGPLVYVIILFSSILLFWRSNLAGVVALSAMAAGDGCADLAGRRFGKNNKWFFSPDKSVVGTTTFFVASLIASLGLSHWLNYMGSIPNGLPYNGGIEFVLRLSIICGLSALIELIPAGDDNWTVPISAAALSSYLLP